MNEREEEMYAAAERVRHAAEELRISIAERGWDNRQTQSAHSRLSMAILAFSVAEGHEE